MPCPRRSAPQAACPKRQVVSLSGDGGLTMLMGDLITLKQQNLPVKVMVYNNGVLGFVAMEMKATGFLDTYTDLENPNFAAMAESMGIFGIRVEDPGEVEDAVRRGLHHDGPVVIDVATNKLELMMPPTVSASQVAGFGMYMLRAVINGRGSELIELAKTNLRR